MLYIIATPIGNLKDITYRAIEVLKNVEIILCEDTRVTKKILNHFEIKQAKLISYHHHTTEKKTKELVELIKKKEVALVTDAGTPGISDPGGKIIAELPENILATPIPGASAVTAALSVSGLPADKFLFLGFIPHKKGRNKFLKRVIDFSETVVFFESPHRIIKCLEQFKELGIEKKFVVCRELTKKFETIYRGNIDHVLESVTNDPVKGEYVIVVN